MPRGSASAEVSWGGWRFGAVMRRARRLFQEAAAIATTINYSVMTREWQAHLALAILHQGDAAAAQKLLIESLRRNIDRENPLVLAQICTYLGEVVLAQGELDTAGDWLEQSLFHHPNSRLINVDEMERLALAARVAAARRDYDRAAILLGQVQAHSRRFDATAARWIRARMDAAMAEVQAGMKPAQFAEGVAYGEGLASRGGIDYAAVMVLAPAAT